MYPPSSSCRALYRLHKNLRLCWVGPKKCFGIVQLYHLSDVGDIDDPDYCYKELWNITTRETSPGYYERVGVDRGAIFNRFGGTSYDYDPLMRIPVWVATLNKDYQYADGEPIRHPEDVYSDKFLLAVESWLAPIKDRLRHAAWKRGRDVVSHVEAMGEEMTDKIWHEGKRPDAATNHDIAYKHARKQISKNDYFVQTRKERLMKYWDLPK